jgi:hypothetical protein
MALPKDGNGLDTNVRSNISVLRKGSVTLVPSTGTALQAVCEMTQHLALLIPQALGETTRRRNYICGSIQKKHYMTSNCEGEEHTKWEIETLQATSRI